MEKKERGPKQNSILFFSVADRFTLRYRYAQHAVRSLAEKQALIKFHDLKYDIPRPSEFEAAKNNICHPIKVGRYLATSSNTQGGGGVFEELNKKQKRFLLPYLTDYVEIIDRDTFMDGTRYRGKACNLRQLPDPTVLTDKATVNLFDFYHTHCHSYIPIQVIELKTNSTDPQTLRRIGEWFNSQKFSTEEQKEVMVALKASEEKNAVIPFQVLLYVLNLSLTARKITPHVAIPYHLYQGIDSSRLQTVEPNGKLWLTTESPEIPLSGFAVLDPEIAKNENRYRQWYETSKKNLTEILTPVFVVAYTLYMLALLGIYERPFTDDARGLPWVEENIRAHKIHSYGYWTYLLPPHVGSKYKTPTSYPEMVKYVPNFGLFWLICDFSIFQSVSERKRAEDQKEVQVPGKGILYYLIQSLMNQVSTWDRKSRRSIDIESVQQGGIGSLELEINELSSNNSIVSTSDILHRLDHLRAKLARPYSLNDPMQYRAFMEEVIFLSWNMRPGGLKVATKNHLKQQQVSLTLQEFERNCVLQNEIRATPSGSVSYLENLELDVFGWNHSNPLVLSNLFQELFKVQKYNLEYLIQYGFQDESMEDMMHDAQHKANLLQETEQFWEVIRRISHLYFRDTYDTLRNHPGEESWNPTIPRIGPIQTSEDCFRYGYTILSQHEGQDWYSFLERELLSRHFQIDAYNVTEGAKDLVEEITKASSHYGPEFVKKLKSRLVKLPSQKENRLFPTNLLEIKQQLDLLLAEEKKNAKEIPNTLPKHFLDIQQKYSPSTDEKKTEKEQQLTIEKLDELFPDLISLISLLPEVYRNKILAPSEDVTLRDKKKELQDRVFKLQKHLKEIEYDQLVEDYPVPKGRKPLRTTQEKKEKQQLEKEKHVENLPPEPLILKVLEPPPPLKKNAQVEEFPWQPQPIIQKPLQVTPLSQSPGIVSIPTNIVPPLSLADGPKRY